MRDRNLDVTLAQWAQDRVGVPFAWGATDCGSLVADVLAAQGRVVTVPEYATPLAAGRALLVHGRNGFHDWLAAAGLEPLPSPLYAQTGDVLVWGRSEAAPVVGPHAIRALHDGGVTPEPLARCAADATCYRVPRDG